MAGSPSPALQGVLDRFEEIGRELGLKGGWTCDGGAGVLLMLCEQADINAELVVGLYHWPEEKLAQKWELMEGCHPGDDDLADYWDDEHHHWVEAEGFLLDPNGEIRGEPRFRTLDSAYDEADPYYEPFRQGQRKAFTKVLCWSPYWGADEDDGVHHPREAAAWMTDLRNAIPYIDATPVA